MSLSDGTGFLTLLMHVNEALVPCVRLVITTSPYDLWLSHATKCRQLQVCIPFITVGVWSPGHQLVHFHDTRARPLVSPRRHDSISLFDDSTRPVEENMLYETFRASLMRYG